MGRRGACGEEGGIVAVKHTIRFKEELKEVTLTPLGAIRAFCSECVSWISDEIDKCIDHNCPLYLFRSGSNPSRKGMGFGKK